MPGHKESMSIKDQVRQMTDEELELAASVWDVSSPEFMAVEEERQRRKDNNLGWSALLVTLAFLSLTVAGFIIALKAVSHFVASIG